MQYWYIFSLLSFYKDYKWTLILTSEYFWESWPGSFWPLTSSLWLTSGVELSMSMEVSSQSVGNGFNYSIIGLGRDMSITCRLGLGYFRSNLGHRKTCWNCSRLSNLGLLYCCFNFTRNQGWAFHSDDQSDYLQSPLGNFLSPHLLKSLCKSDSRLNGALQTNRDHRSLSHFDLILKINPYSNHLIFF